MAGCTYWHYNHCRHALFFSKLVIFFLNVVLHDSDIARSDARYVPGVGCRKNSSRVYIVTPKVVLPAHLIAGLEKNVMSFFSRVHL